MSTYSTIVHFPFLTFSALTFSLRCATLLLKEDLPLIVARRLYSWGFTCGKSSFLYSTAIPSLERRLFIYFSSGKTAHFKCSRRKKPKRSLLSLCKHQKKTYEKQYTADPNCPMPPQSCKNTAKTGTKGKQQDYKKVNSRFS